MDPDDLAEQVRITIVHELAHAIGIDDVIAVDDLQWGDDDSAALLREVLTGPDAPSVLFIATLLASVVRGKRQANSPGKVVPDETP